eukprot:SAG31_NODE_4518_length_3166_cov_1.642253_1_plen_201_part_00
MRLSQASTPCGCSTSPQSNVWGCQNEWGDLDVLVVPATVPGVAAYQTAYERSGCPGSGSLPLPRTPALLQTPGTMAADPAEEVAAIAALPGLLWIDVRTDPKEELPPPDSSANPLGPQRIVVAWPLQELLAANSEAAAAKIGGGNKYLRLLVFCDDGSEASRAKAALQDLGFKRVLNGGGVADVAPLAKAGADLVVPRGW